MNIQNWRTDLIESELTDKAKLVGLVLSVYWNSRNKIYPSLTTLENDCSLTKNTIIKAIEELKGGNFVIVNKEHHRKSSYMVNTYTLTGVTTAPMNAPVNDTVNEQANDRANDSVASAPMNAPELGIRELGIKEDTIVSKKVSAKVQKDYTEDFEEVYKLFDVAERKYPAFKKWLQLTKEAKAKIKEVLPIYVSCRPDKQYRGVFANWIAEKRWNDDPESWKSRSSNFTQQVKMEEYYDDATGKIKQRAVV